MRKPKKLNKHKKSIVDKKLNPEEQLKAIAVQRLDGTLGRLLWDKTMDKAGALPTRATQCHLQGRQGSLLESPSRSSSVASWTLTGGCGCGCSEQLH